MIKNLVDFIAQVILDFAIGMVVYFGLSVIFPAWNTTFVVAVAVFVAVIFAEKFEVRIKR